MLGRPSFLLKKWWVFLVKYTWCITQPLVWKDQLHYLLFQRNRFGVRKQRSPKQCGWWWWWWRWRQWWTITWIRYPYWPLWWSITTVCKRHLLLFSCHHNRPCAQIHPSTPTGHSQPSTSETWQPKSRLNPMEISWCIYWRCPKRCYTPEKVIPNRYSHQNP